MTTASQEALQHVYLILALSPIICSVLLFACASGISASKGATFYNFAYHLDPRRGLASQWPLRFWLFTIIVYFLAAGVICWAPYTLSFTPEGFDTFIEISKFPIALISLTIPIGVFISRLHSTQQTAAQIEATDMKNRLDAFHAQRKGIVEYIASLGTVELANKVSLKIQINQAFHSEVFRNSTHETGALEADERVLSDVASQVSSVLDDLASVMPGFKSLEGRLHKNPNLNLEGIYLGVVTSVNALCEKLSVTDYVIDPQNKKMTFTSVENGARQQNVRLAASYYELIAILNYCVTVSYYALISESRSRINLNNRLRMEALKKELTALGRDTSMHLDGFAELAARRTIYPGPMAAAVTETS